MVLSSATETPPRLVQRLRVDIDGASSIVVGHARRHIEEHQSVAALVLEERVLPKHECPQQPEARV